MDNVEKVAKDILSGGSGEKEAKRPLPKAVGLAKNPEKGFLINLYEDLTGRTIEQTVTEAKDSVKQKIFSSIGEIISDCVDDFFSGGTRSKKGGKVSYGASVVKSYDNPSWANARNNNSSVKAAKSSRYDFEDLLFHTRSEAEDFKRRLISVIEETGQPISVAELYDAMDDPTHMEPTDDFYGWDDLRNAFVKRNYSGLYRLYLPEPKPIQRTH